MSILIACKKGDTVYLGTDTRLVEYNQKNVDLCEFNYKIQKVESGILVGIVCDNQVRNVLFANSEIFTLDKKGELTRKHLIKEIIPKIISVLDENELIVKEDGDTAYMRAIIMLAYKGVLYEVNSNFLVIRYEDFQVVGKNAEYAIATIMDADDSEPINDNIVRALKIAGKNSLAVGAPYLLIDTKFNAYTLVGGNE